MAIDIYSGPLTRYYSGNWKNAGQTWAEENNVPYNIIRPNDADSSESEPVNIPQLIETIKIWCSNISEGLKDTLDVEFDWKEGNELEYIAMRITPNNYQALLLRVYYLEENLAPPETFAAAMAERFPAEQPKILKGVFKTIFGKNKSKPSNETPRRSEYRCLLLKFWLPYDFDFSFIYPTLTEDGVEIGSSVQLLKELEKLNATLWKATPNEIASWDDSGSDSFDGNAKVAFAALYRHAKYSVDHKMPMLIDS